MNLKASLNKSAYTHGENVNVTIDVRNDSRKVVRKIRVSFNPTKRDQWRGKLPCVFMFEDLLKLAFLLFGCFASFFNP